MKQETNNKMQKLEILAAVDWIWIYIGKFLGPDLSKVWNFWDLKCILIFKIKDEVILVVFLQEILANS